MKISAIAPANVALIKYWGRKDEILRLPANGSISVNLSNLSTHTTIEFLDGLDADEVTIDDAKIDTEGVRVTRHLDRIRALAKISTKAKVVSRNSFPAGTGLSSSSSGFAALSVAAATAAGLKLDEKELSILARQGSGSACRSIPNGWVQWHDGTTSEESFAESFTPVNHWDIQDIVAVVSKERKDVSTSFGQKSAHSSPFFTERIGRMEEKIKEMKQHISNKDFTAFGELTESEALELHAIMITSRPSLIYWSTGTLQLMKEIKKWRTEGLEAYFTINTGQDMHILVQKVHATKLIEKLKTISYVNKILENTISNGTHITNHHLF
ncbi:MAG: diphosphomevalonate decarboxylase [bacterium]|nr:diphosphomevalonate decarboxylase [bacterium]